VTHSTASVCVSVKDWVTVVVISQDTHRSYNLVGAPVGSCIVGTKDFIARARWFRKLFGGGMRQIGVLAGCAAYALNHNFPQLPRVHDLARRLEAGLRELGVRILGANTCMVRCPFPSLVVLVERYRSSLTPNLWVSSTTRFRNARQNFQNR
jgi:threonine aldolase